VEVIIAAGLAILVIGGGFYLYRNTSEPSVEEDTQVETVVPIDDEETSAVADIVDFSTCVETIGKTTSTVVKTGPESEYSYQYCEVPEIGRFTKSVEAIEPNYELQTFHSPHPFNLVQKIVYRLEDTGEEEIIIPNVLEAISDAEFIYLSPIAYVESENKIYFDDIVPESDAPPGNIYAFNIISNKFEYLEISIYYSNYLRKAYSSGGELIAIAGDATVGDAYAENPKVQNLMLLNLIDDTAEPIVVLQGNETLDRCGSVDTCAFGPSSEVEWIDDNTIEYAVYNRDDVFEEPDRISYYDDEGRPQWISGGIYRALIEKRRIEIDI